MKLVINKCYGGFGLSHAAMLRYAEIRGITLYPEKGRFAGSWDYWRFAGSWDYWTVPPDKRPEPQEGKWHTWTQEQRVASNRAHEEARICAYSIKRDDAALVQVVEELGSAADGEHAELRVVEIPDGIEWHLDEHDGIESVHESHRSWS